MAPTVTIILTPREYLQLCGVFHQLIATLHRNEKHVQADALRKLLSKIDESGR